MRAEARLSYLLTAVAGGLAVTLVRNETQRHSAALKNAGQNPVSLLPLGGSVSAVSSFQLRPVFSAVSSRVPPSNTMSCFVGFGDKSRDSFKNSFQTRGFEFSFLSQGAQRAAFRGSISTKAPVLKLKCLFACEPPAAIGSKSTQVAFKQFAKLQVAGLHFQ